jgi:hypothetical protein
MCVNDKETTKQILKHRDKNIGNTVFKKSLMQKVHSFEPAEKGTSDCR